MNYVAVFVAAIASMVIGSVWYGPLFGKKWMASVGMTEKKMEEAKKGSIGKTYFITFLGSLVTAYVLAMLVGLMGTGGWVTGAQAGFLAWLGFVAPVSLTNKLFEGKPMDLFAINAGNNLVSLLAMGAILAVLV